MLKIPFSPVLALCTAILLPNSAIRADVFYVTDASADRLLRVNQAGAESAIATTGMMTPEQAVYDPAGDFYVADSALGKVLKFSAAGGGPTQVGNDVPGVCALGFDGTGVLHVLNPTDDTVRKLSGASFEIVVTLTGNPTPRSLAFGPNGNIYVADASGNRIIEATPQGGQSTFSDDVTAPFAVAFDAAGQIHVTDAATNGRIASFNPNGKSRALITDLGAIRGLAFDRANIPHYLSATGDLRKVIGKTETAPVATSLGDVRLLTARGPDTQVIAVKGQTLTEPDSATFASFGSPAIGDQKVVFKATLAPPSGGVGTSNALGIWRTRSDGTLQLLARKSFPLPNSSDLIVQTMGDPVMDEAGAVAFMGSLRPGVGGVTTANAKAVFSDCGGAPLRAVLRKGDAAPGLEAGVKFTGFKQLVLPPGAGPAVVASIAGTNVNAGNNLGLWASDTAGTFSLVIRRGDMITVGGRSRKLTSFNVFSVSPLSQGQTRHFGDNGVFTFLGRFSDGYTAIVRAQSGMPPVVLVEKLGAVEEPGDGRKFGTLYSPAMSADAAAVVFNSKLVPNFGGIIKSSALTMFLHTGGVNQVLAQASFAAYDVANSVYSTFGDPVVAVDGDFAFRGKMKPGVGGVLTSDATAIWQNLGSGFEVAVRQGEVAPGIPKLPKFTTFKQFVLPATGGVVFTATVAGAGITSANKLGVWASDGAGGA